MNNTHRARRTLQILDGVWNRIMRREMGGVFHVYSIPTEQYTTFKNEVVAHMAKYDAALRRAGGHYLSYGTLGEMSRDCLFSLGYGPFKATKKTRP